jgi:hypothetical protein
MANAGFEGWAIVEIFGHRRIAGFVREVEIFGVKMAQVEVPALPEMRLIFGTAAALPAFVQRLAGAAIFSITEVTEEAASQAAANIRAHAPTEITSEFAPSMPRLAAAEPDDDDHHMGQGDDDEDEADPPAGVPY